MVLHIPVLCVSLKLWPVVMVMVFALHLLQLLQRLMRLECWLIFQLEYH